MKKFLFSIILFSVCAVFTGLYAQAQEAKSTNANSSVYKLRHNDELEMSILQEPEITRLYNRISADGFATFPLIGKVHLEGLTLSQAEALLTKLYKEDYFVDPVVMLNILRYAKQSCFVVGFVNAPQEYVFPVEESDRITITKVIAGCNGFSPRANRTNVIVKRRTAEGKDINFNINVKKILQDNVSDFKIINGDVIEVPEDIF